MERQIRELEKEERKEFLARAAAYIGKCYETDYYYVKILDVPQEEQILTCCSFNKNQFPACFIFKNENEEYPYVLDTLFFKIEGENPLLEDKPPQEISKEQFNFLLRQATLIELERLENV